jgi:hypothetical protein
MACRNEEPARRALAIRVMVSGSCLLKAPSRPFRRRASQKRGSRKPISAPISRKSGLPRAGRNGDRANIATGMPTIEAPQMSRNSDGLSLRSARAMSRARFAPKSRCSTTLLRLLRAWLWAISSAMPP